MNEHENNKHEIVTILLKKHKELTFNEIVKMIAELGVRGEISLCKAIYSMKYDIFCHTNYWKAVTQEVKNRANNRCVICNSSNKLLAHHRNYKIHGKEHQYFNELTCLCNSCHFLFHKKSDNLDVNFINVDSIDKKLSKSPEVQEMKEKYKSVSEIYKDSAYKSEGGPRGIAKQKKIDMHNLIYASLNRIKDNK